MASNVGRIVRKVLLTVLIVAVAVPFLLLALAGGLLHSGAAGKIARSFIDKHVDARVSYSYIKGSVLHIPKLTLDIEDLVVSYPHERFDSLSIVPSSFSMEGRGEVSDTLLSIRSFKAGVNLLELMKGTIWVSFADIQGLRAYIHQYDAVNANWNVFVSKAKKDTTEKKSGLIPDIVLKRVDIGDEESRVVFCSHCNNLATALDIHRISVMRENRLENLTVNTDIHADFGRSGVFSAPVRVNGSIGLKRKLSSWGLMLEDLQADIIGIPFQADGKFVFREGIVAVDGSASIPNFPLGDFVGTNKKFLPKLSKKMSTNLVLSVSADASGVYSARDKIYPSTSLRIKIPRSDFSYDGVVDGGKIDMDVYGHMSPDMVLDARINDFCLCGAGVDLNASGSVDDIIGKNLKLNLDVNSKIDVSSLLSIIMQNKAAFNADGSLELTLNAKDITRKQMSLNGMIDADVKAELIGDVLDISAPGQDFSAHIDHPKINLGTIESQLVKGSNAIAALIKADSLDVRFNGQYIKGRNVNVMAQDAARNMMDTSSVPPISARIKADILAMRGSDSLTIATQYTDNELIIKPIEVEETGTVVPDISLTSHFGKIAYISPSNRLALKEIDLSASARKKAPRSASQTMKHRYSQVNQKMDSLYVPEFMKEKDFRSADINFSLAKTFQDFFSVWNPSCSLNVRDGLLYFSAYPVNNRVRNIDLSMNSSAVEIKNAVVMSGKSDLSLSARLTGIRKMMTGRGRGMLGLDVDVDSKSLDLNEILTALQASKTTKSTVANDGKIENIQQLTEAFADTLSMDSLKDSAVTGYPLFIVPANLNASVSVNADKIKYAGFDFNTINASLNMRERCIQLSDLKASSDMGSVQLDAFYSTLSKDSINLGYDLSLMDVTAGKVIGLFPRIGEVLPILGSFKGIIDFDFTATSKIDTCMNLVLPSLNGVAEINGEDLVIEDLASVKKLANLLKFKDRKTGHIDDMNIKAIIGDNQIEIFPFVLGIDRYQLALTGSQVFPQDYVYHISVIKSPLPFKMGIKVYGRSYKAVKYGFEKPQYTSTKLPLYDNQVEELQINLINSIKNIFDKGVTAAINQTQRERLAITRKKENLEDQEEVILSAKELQEADMELYKLQMEEEDELLTKEIDDILNSF